MLMKSIRTFAAVALASTCALLSQGCSPIPQFDDLTVREAYDVGTQAMARGDHLVATEAFRRITLDSPMHELADDALLGLADAYRSVGDHASAEEAYRRLQADYPRSPLVGEAAYKLGLSYYEQSPPTELDQKLTREAIEQFEAFRVAHPEDPLVAEATSKIAELRARLAEKDYESAMLYFTLESPDAAKVYLTAVIDEYGGTVWAGRSLLALARVLCSEGSTAQGAETYSRLIDEYPGTDEAAAAAVEAEGCGR